MVMGAMVLSIPFLYVFIASQRKINGAFVILYKKKQNKTPDFLCALQKIFICDYASTRSLLFYTIITFDARASIDKW